MLLIAILRIILSSGVYSLQKNAIKNFVIAFRSRFDDLKKIDDTMRLN